MHKRASILVFLALLLLSSCPPDPPMPPVPVPDEPSDRICTEVTPDRTVIDLIEGETKKINLTFTPEGNYFVGWLQSDYNNIDLKDGLITALHAATGINVSATVYNSDESRPQCTCIVNVYPAATSMFITPGAASDPVSLKAGKTQQLSISLVPEGARTRATPTWESSDSSICSVSSSGVITAIAEGTATISARYPGGLGATKTVSVLAPDAVTIINSDGEMWVGDNRTLSLRPSSDYSPSDITWTSSSPGVASVDSSGKVTALSRGNATITATLTTDSSRHDSLSVSVKQPITNVVPKVNGRELSSGDTEYLEAFSGNVNIDLQVLPAIHDDELVIKKDGVAEPANSYRVDTSSYLAVAKAYPVKQTYTFCSKHTGSACSTLNLCYVTADGVTVTNRDGEVVDASANVEFSPVLSTTLGIKLSPLDVPESLKSVSLEESQYGTLSGSTLKFGGSVNTTTAITYTLIFDDLKHIAYDAEKGSNVVTPVKKNFTVSLEPVLTEFTLRGNPELTPTSTPGEFTSVTTAGKETRIMRMTQKPAGANCDLKWQFSDDSAVTINQNQTTSDKLYFTPKKAGTLTVTATSESNPSLSQKIVYTVNDLAATAIYLGQMNGSSTLYAFHDMEMFTGTTIGLGSYKAFSPVKATNTTLEWTSSDESVICVTQDGQATALKEGTATITIKNKVRPGDTQRSYSLTVKVTNNPQGQATPHAGAKAYYLCYNDGLVTDDAISTGTVRMFTPPATTAPSASLLRAPSLQENRVHAAPGGVDVPIFGKDIPLEKPATVSTRRARSYTPQMSEVFIEPSVGDERTFWAEYGLLEDSDGKQKLVVKFRQVPFVLRHQDGAVRVWTQAYTDPETKAKFAISDAEISSIAAKMGQTISAVTDVFGEVATKFGSDGSDIEDSKINVLIYDIDGDYDYEGAYTAGYHFGNDLLYPAGTLADNGSEMHTNGGRYVYLDVLPIIGRNGENKNISTAISCLAHEFTHMVNFSQKYVIPKSQGSSVDLEEAFPTWWTEMCAMISEDLTQRITGVDIKSTPQYSRYGYYVQKPWYEDTSVRPLSWGEGVWPYSVNYMFMTYMAHNFGGLNFVKNTATNSSYGLTSLIDAASSATSREVTKAEVLHGYPEAYLFTKKAQTGYKTFTSSADGKFASLPSSEESIASNLDQNGVPSHLFAQFGLPANLYPYDFVYYADTVASDPVIIGIQGQGDGLYTRVYFIDETGSAVNCPWAKCTYTNESL